MKKIAKLSRSASKRYSGDIRCSFNELAGNVLSKAGYFSAQIPKVMKNTVTFLKKKSSNVPLITLNTFLTTLPKTFCQKSKMFSLNLLLWWILIFFSIKVVLLVLISWTRKMQFGQRCWKKFEKAPKNFVVKSKTIRKIIYIFSISRKLFFLRMFLWTPRMHFWQAFRKLSTKIWTGFWKRKSGSDGKKCNFFDKIPKAFLYRRQMKFWQTCRKLSGKSWIVFRSYSGSAGN